MAPQHTYPVLAVSGPRRYRNLCVLHFLLITSVRTVLSSYVMENYSSFKPPRSRKKKLLTTEMLLLHLIPVKYKIRDL